MDVRRRVGTDGVAHVAERAGRAHALELAALERVDAAPAVDQIEEPREALAQVFAAAAGVTDAGDPAQLILERARVQERGRLPVDGGACGGPHLPRRGPRAALSRGRRGWSRQ